jgi:hypothetical protein
MDEKKRQQQENKDRKLTARYQVTDSRWTDSKFENDPFGRADAETTDPDLRTKNNRCDYAKHSDQSTSSRTAKLSR